MIQGTMYVEGRAFGEQFFNDGSNAKIASLLTALHLAKELGLGARFYAKDVGVDGRTLNSLEIVTNRNLIRLTGNERECGFYCVDPGDDLYRKCYAKEWEIVDNPDGWMALAQMMVDASNEFRDAVSAALIG